MFLFFSLFYRPTVRKNTGTTDQCQTNTEYTVCSLFGIIQYANFSYQNWYWEGKHNIPTSLLFLVISLLTLLGDPEVN